jgi:hypothetical protein
MKSLRIWGIATAGVLVGAVLMTATGAFGLTGGSAGQLSLNAGESLSVGCGGPSVSWSQTNATQGMASCAPGVTTTTTVPGTTTTTVAPTTTTVPSTTTTVPVTTTTVPSGGSSGCVFASSPGAVPAFCDTFGEGPAVNGPADSREGQLNGTVWGVSRYSSNENFNGVSADDWAEPQLSTCGSTALVNPPADVQVCNGELVETLNDGSAVSSLAMYPKQPFDFAGRTGTIVFNVNDDSQGGHGAWPELWMADQPVPVPFAHGVMQNTLNLPRNGFGIRFAGCTDSNGVADQCAGGSPAYVGVDSAITVTNYTESDSISSNPTNLTVEGLGSVKESGPGQVNHFEIKVSQNQIDVYGTNAYTPGQAVPALVHIATIPNVNLGFTRGLVYLEDAHYNGNKFGTQGNHTFTWSDLGFDGPVLGRDLTFDVPNNTKPDNSTQSGTTAAATDLGYWVAPGTALNVGAPGVTSANIAAAAGALVTFDYLAPPISPVAQTIDINGHAIAVPAASLTMAVAVPLADVVAGTNTITFNGGATGENVMNIDLILQGAGGPGGIIHP